MDDERSFQEIEAQQRSDAFFITFGIKYVNDMPPGPERQRMFRQRHEDIDRLGMMENQEKEKALARRRASEYDEKPPREIERSFQEIEAQQRSAAFFITFGLQQRHEDIDLLGKMENRENEKMLAQEEREVEAKACDHCDIEESCSVYNHVQYETKENTMYCMYHSEVERRPCRRKSLYKQLCCFQHTICNAKKNSLSIQELTDLEEMIDKKGINIDPYYDILINARSNAKS